MHKSGRHGAEIAEGRGSGPVHLRAVKAKTDLVARDSVAAASFSFANDHDVIDGSIHGNLVGGNLSTDYSEAVEVGDLAVEGIFPLLAFVALFRLSIAGGIAVVERCHDGIVYAAVVGHAGIAEPRRPRVRHVAPRERHEHVLSRAVVENSSLNGG